MKLYNRTGKKGALLHLINLTIKGFFIGVANVIPGMSGGTMAMVLGVYERMIGALHRIGVTTAIKVLRIVTLKRGALTDGLAELRRIDFGFLTLIAIGAMLAIVASSRLIILLLKQYHDPTYGFFCGLILTSIIVPLKIMKTFTVKALIFLLIAVAMPVGLSMNMGGESALEKHKLKKQFQTNSLIPRETAETVSTRQGGKIISFSTANHSAGRIIYLFVCGAVAVSAMILPGISGSFILLLLGVYFDILAAINNRDAVVLAIFAFGCGIGILAFSRLLNHVLKHYHDLTVSVLIGLMLGSVYGIWPFRRYEIVDGERIDIEHIMPQADINLLITALMFFIGCGIVLLFYRFKGNETAQLN